jgi:hydroxyacylglutathione hydrolase
MGRVFSGDVLFLGSVGRTDLPLCDAAQLVKSIREKMYTLPEEFVILPGHGPETTVGHEKHTNPFVSATYAAF